jgi:hypothetical protein
LQSLLLVQPDVGSVHMSLRQTFALLVRVAQSASLKHCTQ